MTSNNNKSVTEHHENEPSSEMIVKANKYPPGYPDNHKKEQCNKKDGKHENCHPMHCHHLQPMQSAISTDQSPDPAQQNSKK